MKKALLTALFVMALASSASAQNSAGCATPALSGNVVTATATFDLYVCVPASSGIDGIVLELNGAKSYPASTPEAASTTGRVAFPATITLPGRGNHTIRTGSYTLKADGSKQEGPLGAPFVLVYEKAAPTVAPTNHPR